MSRSGKKSKLFSNIIQAAKSVLFRRLVLSWTIILAALLVGIVTLLIVTINAIYSANEARSLSTSIEQVTMVRELLARDGISQEDADLLFDHLSEVSGISCILFERNDDGISVADMSNKSAPGPSEDELAELGRRLFKEGELGQSRIELGGTNYVAAGRTLSILDKDDQAVVCLRSTAGFIERQITLLAYTAIGLVVTFIAGMAGIALLLSSYIMPFTEIANAAIDMSQGHLGLRVGYDNERGEIGLLSRSFNKLSASLSQYFTELEQERSRLVQIVNSSSNGIAVTDETGELIQYNPALVELFSQSASTHGPADDKRLAVIPDRSVWERFDRVNSSGVSERIVYPVDEERVLWINISPVISAEGEQVGVIGYFQDMTELERLERTRREYVANVSHELRRPLTALQGLLEPIRDGLVKSETDKQRYYDIMLHEIERLTRLISDMMQLSHLQSDIIKLQLEPQDISEIVADVAESYRADIESRGMTLDISAAEGLFANIDADRLEQITIILLDNAIKFTPDGGSVDIRTFREGGRVCMEVADTGCGISKEDQPHVFERFYKADKPHTAEGTGLGLSIADNIIKKMRGSISCQSELGRGTTMRVEFDECKALPVDEE